MSAPGSVMAEGISAELAARARDDARRQAFGLLLGQGEPQSTLLQRREVRVAMATMTMLRGLQREAGHAGIFVRWDDLRRAVR